jgi:nicotinamidase/pyrazinamidase
MRPHLRFVKHDALIVVDMQNDFFPGGALGIAGAPSVLEVLNHYLAHLIGTDVLVFATRCWHPANHCSFTAQGGPWPAHCVAGTSGAEFHADLHLPMGCPVISKGHLQDRDAYSAFQGTELDPLLRERGIRRVFIGGLATDFCVKHTVLDVLSHRLPAFVLADAIAAVAEHPTDEPMAIRDMLDAGAVLVDLESFNP